MPVKMDVQPHPRASTAAGLLRSKPFSSRVGRSALLGIVSDQGRSYKGLEFVEDLFELWGIWILSWVIPVKAVNKALGGLSSVNVSRSDRLLYRSSKRHGGAPG